MQHSHCSYCGHPYLPEAPWPRRCAGCGEMTWRNPLPVAVALLPVDLSGDLPVELPRVLPPDRSGRRDRGLLVVRRAIEPGYGELGLPGGYIESGESWREAAVRELREETTIVADPDQIRLFDVHSVPRGGPLLVFGLLPPRPAEQLPPVTPTEEATEWLVVASPIELVFSTHTRAMADYFASDYAVAG